MSEERIEGRDMAVGRKVIEEKRENEMRGTEER